METEVYKIIKIGKHEYMDPFFRQGEMFFNTIDEFAIMDANEERNDTLEGSIEIKQVDWIKLQDDKGKTIEFSRTNPKANKLFNAFYTARYDKSYGNIYSCCAITPDTFKNFAKFNPRFEKLGDTLILIDNPNEFFNRVENALKNKGYKFTTHPVTYYDPYTFNGSLTVFHKKKDLNYQNELRIFVQNEMKVPIKICIGSIMDIAIKIRMYDLMKIQKYEA